METLDVKEVARLLKVKEATVYRMVKEKKLPATKLRGKILFTKQSLDKFLESKIWEGFENEDKD